jgi:hypothetical protein
MEAVNRNEAVVLGIVLDGSDLTIRIDRNGLAQSQFEGIPVINLVLHGCSDVVPAFDKLSESIDKPLDYEIIERADGTTVLFWIDYHPDEIEIKCARVAEVASDYTTDDWKRKSVRLSRLYLASANTSELYQYMYFLLRDSLRKRLSREIEVCQRKIDFFSQANPEKAEPIKAHMRAYQQLLALMGQDKEQSIMLQMEQWILREWDDDLPDPRGYHEMVRRRIIDMGEVVVFPLLELLGRHSDDFMSNEVLHILGLVNPQTLDAVRARLK